MNKDEIKKTMQAVNKKHKIICKNAQNETSKIVKKYRLNF